MPTPPNINYAITAADAHDNDIDGGLDLKSDPASVASPKTTRADNCWYVTPGQVKQLPAFATQYAALSATGATAPYHVYNLHARDGSAGSAQGDIMVHGEFADALGSSTNLFTTPLWAHNMGQTTTPSMPALPYVARTRQIGASASPNIQASYGVNTYDANLNTPLMVKQDVAGSDGRLRYAVLTNGFYASRTTLASVAGITATFGYLEDGGEVVEPAISVKDGTYLYVQAQALPYTSNWALVTSTGAGGLVCQNYDFNGVAQGSPISFGTGAGLVPGVSQPIDLFQHNGSLWCAYADRASGSSPWNLYVMNLSTRGPAILVVSGSSSAGTTPGAAAFSATPAAQGLVTTYFAALFQGSFYIISMSSAGSMSVVTSQTSPAPPTASSVPGIQQATGAGVIFDTLGGTGSTAKLGFVAYRIYNEVVGVPSFGGTSTTDLQSVAVDRYTFTASSSTLAYVGLNVFRTPAGATLASKAFSTNPAGVSLYGPQAAKTVVCAVRTGSNDLPQRYGKSIAAYGQPTYFLIDHQANIVGRWFDGAAPAANMIMPIATTNPPVNPTGLSLPLASSPQSDICSLRIQFGCWSLVQAQFAPSNNIALTGTFTAPTNTPINPSFVPAVYDLQYQAQATHVPPIRAGSHALFSGPVTMFHDGRILSEVNFHTAAYNIGVTASQGGTVLGPAATYYYSLVWTWIDSLGRKHRSQPSLAQSVTVTGSFYGANVCITAPLGNKFASGNPPICEVYRSLSNATDANSYLVLTVAVPPMGTLASPATASVVLVGDVTFTDSYTSGGTSIVGTLSAQPRMYTSISASSVSNVYPSSAPPPFTWMVASKGRAAGLAYVQGEARLYYSSADSFGIPLEWNQFNYVSVPGEIGEARSVEAIDDKYVILGTRANAVINGDGPPPSNTAGIPSPGDGFSSVTPLPTPAGVLGTGSPVRIPAGVLYQGPSGIMAIGRDLGLTPMGAPVDPLTGRQVGNLGTIFGRATLLPSLQSVVWCNPLGPALVLNYITSAWSTWPLLSYAQSMVQRLNGDVWVGIQPMLGTIPAASTTVQGADLGVLTANTFAYNSPAPTGPAMVVETGWIAVGNTQAGLGWLREMALYGGYIGPHILQIEQALDYQAYLPPMTWTVGTAPPNYEFQLRPTSSSVRAVRYRVTLLPLTTLSAQYQTATLNDLALFAGVKQGTARLSGDNSR